MEAIITSPSTSSSGPPVEYLKSKEFSEPKDNDTSDQKYNSIDLLSKTETEWVPANKRVYDLNLSHSVSVFDVADYILKKTGQITTMKLQKLVYYCQAWSLVWDDAALFSEPIEAWANGPVVRNLFAYHRGMFNITSVSLGNPMLLSQTQKETIEAVVDFYGKKSSQWLADLTHMEEPWKKARAGLPDLVRGDRVISLDSMAEYYSSISKAE